MYLGSRLPLATGRWFGLVDKAANAGPASRPGRASIGSGINGLRHAVATRTALSTNLALFGVAVSRISKLGDYPRGTVLLHDHERRRRLDDQFKLDVLVPRLDEEPIAL